MAVNDSDIAIVGMAGRFPGARNIDEFWQNLVDGVESITRLSDAEILASGVPKAFLTSPTYVKAAPVLEEPGHFDAAFFGFSPKEASMLDPQHRLLLELAHEALENAGVDPDGSRSRVGVFAGAALNTYFTESGLNRRLSEDYIPTLIGNDKDFLSTRVSYKLNLTGPSITVQTACSTSAVAVHLACQSLLSGETDLALAGAVSVRVPHRAGYFADGGGVASPDGHVRAFDASANGTVFGSGGGVLVLKRLADAVADRDTVRAVIKGSAVNNDGSAKAGYTAPSVNSQADAVVEALANAGVSADTISYVEAHGSGTPVGDPIEVRALTKAFRRDTQRSGFCAIGSVKTNVGHLDAAAAVTGIIKTVLALEHRVLPASLNYTAPNPEIDFPATPFYVNAVGREWASDGPRRAGIMSTGMGGTNAHLVLEEAPETEPLPSSSASPHLIVLSARTESALDTVTSQLGSFLQQNASVNMADVAHTLQRGRKAQVHRRTFVCADRDDAVGVLADPSSKRIVSARATESRPVILLLPGVGDHYVGMGYDLYESSSVFRSEVDRCAQILEPHLGRDIRTILYPAGGRWRKRGAGAGIDLKKMLGRQRDDVVDEETSTLNQTRFAHPALFTIEWAMSRFWQSLGVVPDAIVGHSLGEYVAACLSGVLSLEDALRLVAVRARLVNELPEGAMLAVTLSEDEVLRLLPADMSVSLINGPQLCVVAGPVASVAAFEQVLNDKGVISRRVQNTHAFHSTMLEPIVGAFQREVHEIRLGSPTIRYFSNVTGTWVTDRDATDSSYWATHATRTARFSDGLDAMWRLKDAVLLEAGPGRTLGVLAAQHPGRKDAGNAVVTSSLRHDYEGGSDVEFVYRTIGRLWASGIRINWDGVPQASGRRIPLPTYPFERQRHWIDGERDRAPVSDATGSGDPASVDNWFYVPTWERTPFLTETFQSSTQSDAFWLIISDSSGRGGRLKARLESRQLRTGFLHPGDDYLNFFRDFRDRETGPLHIVHLGSLADATDDSAAFYSLMHIAQAVGELNIDVPVTIGIITSQLHEVTGEERVAPAMASVLGPCGVIPKEFPNVRCFNVDLGNGQAADDLSEEAFEAVLAEFGEAHRNQIVAYRGRYRWERGYKQVLLPHTPVAATSSDRVGRLRRDGVYLITGGTGGIGLALARRLARAGHPTLILTRKTPFPARAMWDSLLSASDTPRRVVRTIEAIREIEALGARVEVCVAEVSDRQQMTRVVDDTTKRFGAIHGVIHAAGIVRPGLILAKTRATADSVLAPKVRGTLILYDLLKDASLDFLVLFSSITTVSTPFAEADYSAANAFLDAFTYFANADGRVHALTINWPGWKEVGQLADLETLPGVEGWKQAAMARAISTEAGLEAFERALNSGLKQVIVSPEPIAQVLEESRTPVDPAMYFGHPDGPTVDSSGRSDYVAPRDETERQIARIWQDALGIGAVSINDSFADLGGHSLIAVRMVAKLRDTFRIDLPIRVLFDAPTIEELSRYIKGDPSAGTTARPRAIVPLQPHGRLTPIFGVPGHNGDVFCYRFLAEHLGSDQPLFGLEPPGLDDHSEPIDSITQLARYFADQIRSFQPDGPYVIAGYCAGGTVAFELAQQLKRSGATVSVLAMFGAPYPDFFRPHSLRSYHVRQAIRGRVSWLASHVKGLRTLSLRRMQGHLSDTLHNRRARLEALRRTDADPVLMLRARVGDTTLHAASEYTPVRYEGRVILFLSGPEWVRSSGMQPLGWHSVAPHIEEYLGPSDCDSDNMLLPEYAGTFAELFKHHQQSLTLPRAVN
ncbi:MAG: SDR family NAD(P)-dependent oxidoreductase [Vicinamibacterales bacterium]